MVKQRRGDEGEANRKHASDAGRESNQAYAKFAKGVKEARADADFDDPILF